MSSIIYLSEVTNEVARKSLRNFFIIAVDGPSGAGKGTVAAYLSDKFNLKHLDTGLIYRAMAAKVAESQTNIEDIINLEKIAQSLTIADTLRPNLRNEEIAARASQIAAIPSIRLILNELQRSFAYSNPGPYKGVILDGRDIGTVICPDADCKIFLTACSVTRARRRTNEVKTPIAESRIQAMMLERDNRDSSRQTAPLQPAEDAYIIDTTNLTIDEVCSTAAYYIEKFCFRTVASKIN